MSVVLYKKGTTHNVRGVECEMQLFNIKSMSGALDSGWVTDPTKLAKKEEAPKEVKEEVKPKTKSKSKAKD